MTQESWSPGDRVVHPSCPEWGVGEITHAAAAMHEGKPCQRLTVRFERGGLKTISTAIAQVRAAASGSANSGWLDDLEAGDPAQRLSSVPDNVTDPFAPLAARLKAAVKLYRFTPAGGPLIEWAAAQTGLADPLSRFTRHELEQAFDKFAHARDNTLHKLVAEAVRKDPAALSGLAADAPPAAQRVLQRACAKR